MISLTMTDLSFTDLAVEVALLRDRVTNLERRRRPTSRALVEQLVEGVAAQGGEMLLSEAQARYGKVTVDAAVYARELYRYRPGGGSTILSDDVHRPHRDDGIDLVAYLRQPVTRIPSPGPRGFASFTQLRKEFGKNRIADAVAAALSSGEIVVGVLETRKPGRPPQAVCLTRDADGELFPRPEYVDGCKTRWMTR